MLEFIKSQLNGKKVSRQGKSNDLIKMFYEKSNKKAVNNGRTSCLNTDIVKSQ